MENTAAWAFPRSRHRALGPSEHSDSLLVTHPFHVLSGHRVRVLFVKRRGAGRVFVCEGGPVGQVTLPQEWTDRGESPAGHRLSVAGLVALDTLRKGRIVDS